MIQSPSVKIQIIARKFTWVNNAKHCWVMSTNFLFSKVSWQCPAIFCLTHQLDFPANNLNFHWWWWDQIQAIFLNLFYFSPPEYFDSKSNNKQGKNIRCHSFTKKFWSIPFFARASGRIIFRYKKNVEVERLVLATRTFFLKKESH